MGLYWPMVMKTTELGWSSIRMLGDDYSAPAEKIVAKVPTKLGVGCFPPQMIFFWTFEKFRNFRWTFVGRINLWMVLGDRSIFHISPSMIDPKAVVVGKVSPIYWGSHPCGKGTVQSAVAIDKIVSSGAWLPNWYQWKIEQMHVELWTNLDSWIQGLL